MINVTFWATLAIICRRVPPEASLGISQLVFCGVEPTYRALYITITTYSVPYSARAVYALVPGSVGAFVAVKRLRKLLSAPHPTIPIPFLFYGCVPHQCDLVVAASVHSGVKPSVVAGVQEGVGLVILEKVLQAMQARDEDEEQDATR